jgi:RHS repeat-associated protein
MSYTYDANDRLTTDSYDNNGNTISSSGISYTYDFENKLLMKSAIVMVYDGDGNRVSETVGSTTTKYLVDTLNPTGYSQVIDETVNGSVTRTFTYGLRPISENQFVSGTWKPSFFGNDGHANVRFLANTAGTITDTYQFDAFGAQIASSGTTSNLYLYSGERFDSNLNLYHLRARYYNMLTGRFMTVDPLQEENSCRSKSASWKNGYAYVSDDPANRIDPTGRAEAVAEYAVDLRPLIYALSGLYLLKEYFDAECVFVGVRLEYVENHCEYKCRGFGEEPFCKGSPCTLTAHISELAPCEEGTDPWDPSRWRK